MTSQCCNVYSILHEVLTIRNVILAHYLCHLFRYSVHGGVLFFFHDLNTYFSDSCCYFSFLGYFMYTLTVAFDHIIAFDPLSLTNPWRIMQAVLYKFVFFAENMCPPGPLSTQELAFENHGLVLLRDSDRDLHFTTTPPPLQMQNLVFITEHDAGSEMTYLITMYLLCTSRTVLGNHIFEVLGPY